MKPHKWAKEIKAWADGAEIEMYKGLNDDIWDDAPNPNWNNSSLIYRIKPQPKEPIINIDELGRNYTRALHDSLIKHKQNLEIEIANIIHEALNEIKPQPKEPQYLYAHQGKNQVWFSRHNHSDELNNCIGKIKLEDE